MSDEDLYLKIRKEAANQHAFQILEALLVFNKHVLKCNFYQPTSMSSIPDLEVMLTNLRGRTLLPIGSLFPSRGRVPQEAIRHVLCRRRRLPRFPRPIPRRRSRWYPNHQVSRKRVSLFTSKLPERQADLAGTTTPTSEPCLTRTMPLPQPRT